MTKNIEILACALALLTLPALGFSQPGPERVGRASEDAALLSAASPGRVHVERSKTDATELGDAGPTVSVVRMLFAKGVSEREPVDAATAFSIADTSHVFAFFELRNAGAEQTVTVSFIDAAKNETMQTYALKVGPYKRFRTWARIGAAKRPGPWTAVLTDEGGNELGRADFTLVE